MLLSLTLPVVPASAGDGILLDAFANMGVWQDFEGVGDTFDWDLSGPGRFDVAVDRVNGAVTIVNRQVNRAAWNNISWVSATSTPLGWAAFNPTGLYLFIDVEVDENAVRGAWNLTLNTSSGNINMDHIFNAIRPSNQTQGGQPWRADAHGSMTVQIPLSNFSRVFNTNGTLQINSITLTAITDRYRAVTFNEIYIAAARKAGDSNTYALPVLAPVPTFNDGEHLANRPFHTNAGEGFGQAATEYAGAVHHINIYHGQVLRGVHQIDLVADGGPGLSAPSPLPITTMELRVNGMPLTGGTVWGSSQSRGGSRGRTHNLDTTTLDDGINNLTIWRNGVMVETVFFIVDNAPRLADIIPAASDLTSLLTGSQADVFLRPHSPGGGSLDVEFYTAQPLPVNGFIVDISDSDGTWVPMSGDDLQSLYFHNSNLTTQSSTDVPAHVFYVDVGVGATGFVALNYIGETLLGERIRFSVFNPNTEEWDEIMRDASSLETSVIVDAGIYTSLEGRIAAKAELIMVGNGSDTFLWLTDTQHYSRYWYLAENYFAVANFAAELYAQGDIAYMVHTGDVVDRQAFPNEWTMVHQAQRIIDEAGLPNGILPGNHDVGYLDHLNYTQWQTYFGNWRYENADWFGGARPGDVQKRTHYDLITIGGFDFVMIHLGMVEEQQPETIPWVNEVLQRYSHRNAVILSHAYLGRYGGFFDDYTHGGGLIGQHVLNNFITPNDNVVMAISGHQHSARTHLRDIDGRQVVEMLANYQSVDLSGSQFRVTGANNPTISTVNGDGFVRLMTITEDRYLDFTTFSPAPVWGPEGRYLAFAEEIDAGRIHMPDLQTAQRELTTVNFTAVALDSAAAAGSETVDSGDGAMAEIDIPANAGWFAAVTCQDTNVTHYTPLVMGELADVEIVVDIVGGGTVAGDGTHRVGDTVTLTATAAEGYVFSHWQPDMAATIEDNPYTFTAAVGGRRLTAVFVSMQAELESVAGHDVDAVRYIPDFNDEPNAPRRYIASVSLPHTVTELTLADFIVSTGATRTVWEQDTAMNPSGFNPAVFPIALPAGETRLQVDVTAQDGATRVIYRLTINRAPVPNYTEVSLIPATLTANVFDNKDGTSTFTAPVNAPNSQVASTLTADGLHIRRTVSGWRTFVYVLPEPVTVSLTDYISWDILAAVDGNITVHYTPVIPSNNSVIPPTGGHFSLTPAISGSNPADFRPGAYTDKITLDNVLRIAETEGHTAFQGQAVAARNFAMQNNGALTIHAINFTVAGMHADGILFNIAAHLADIGSSDASLVSVLGDTLDSPSIGVGTMANPISTSMSLSALHLLGRNDIVVANGATFRLYSDAFATEMTGSNTISLTRGANHIYISVIAEDGVRTLHYRITINIIFTTAPTAEDTPNSWAYADMVRARNAGIVGDALPAGVLYREGAPRWFIAEVLANYMVVYTGLAGIDAVVAAWLTEGHTPFATDFPDVPANHPRYTQIMALATMGVLRGGEFGGVFGFGPDHTLTRAEAAVGLARMMEALGYKTTGFPPATDFADWHISTAQGGIQSWARESVSFLYYHQVMTSTASAGTPPGTPAFIFNPNFGFDTQQLLTGMVRMLLDVDWKQPPAD